MYRLTDARRAKEGTFVVIIHTIPRMPLKKGLREKYMRVRRKCADTPYGLRNLETKVDCERNRFSCGIEASNLSQLTFIFDSKPTFQAPC